MHSPPPIIPPEIGARASARRRLAFAFTPRFFVVLLLGLLCLVPAWWSPQFIRVMFLWDLVAIFLFVWDFLRLPKPSEIEARRRWDEAPCIAAGSRVTLSLRNFSSHPIRVSVTDETPS